MKKISFTLLMIIIFGFARSQNLTPRQMFPGLFETVQLSDIFNDNKTFVDATPKRDPAVILNNYRNEKDKPGFDLKKFVTDNFTLPVTQGAGFKTDISKGVRKHIDTLWQVLSRKHNTASKYSSLIQLPNDFIVPGGRFRETYYWDSYFTMLGLRESHKTKIIQNTINNFVFLIDKYGHIPNGTRTYYLTRSQPPFFSMMLDLLPQDEGNPLVKYQPELLKEYSFWMKGAENLKKGQAYRNVVSMPGGEILNRYWDDSDKPREESFKNDLDSAKKTRQKLTDFYRNIRSAGESGWDFSSRWFDVTGGFASTQTTLIIPVDLNCLLYRLELSIAKSYQLQGNNAKVKFFTAKAMARKQAILKYTWSEKDKWFMDYNWKLQHISPQQTLAGVFPLEFNIPDKREADELAYTLKTKFLKPHGLVTTFVKTGQQWDSPNAWAPLQYMAIDGLTHYNQNGLAKEIAMRWIATNISVFNATGKLTEKYTATNTSSETGGGEYPQQDGFGWTNGILLYLLDHYNYEKTK